MPAGSDSEPHLTSTAAVLELLGRRWALRLLWELRTEPRTFGELKAGLDVSGSVLTQRLTELRENGLLAPAEAGGYELTRHGRSLLAQLDFLEGWASTWARDRGGVSPPQRS